MRETPQQATTMSEALGALVEVIAADRPDLVAVLLEALHKGTMSQVAGDFIAELDGNPRDAAHLVLRASAELNRLVNLPKAEITEGIPVPLLVSLVRLRIGRTKHAERSPLRRLLKRLTKPKPRRGLVEDFLGERTP